MTRSIHRHGLDSGLRPYIPDMLEASNAEGTHFLITRSSVMEMTESSLREFLSSHRMTECQDEEFHDGIWPCVWRDRIEWFSAASEREFRARCAIALMDEAAALKGDPLRAIEILRASSFMAGFGLEDVVTEAEAARRSGEDLADAYLRTKRR